MGKMEYKNILVLGECWKGVNLVTKTGGFWLSGSCVGCLTDQPGSILADKPSRIFLFLFLLFVLNKK